MVIIITITMLIVTFGTRATLKKMLLSLWTESSYPSLWRADRFGYPID